MNKFAKVQKNCERQIFAKKTFVRPTLVFDIQQILISIYIEKTKGNKESTSSKITILLSEK